MPDDSKHDEHQEILADAAEADIADADGAQPHTAEERDSKEQPASPVLEHLDETMKRARQAADEALAPQRE
ncbi:hypothetical protein ABIB25_000764 [Nakamurella sp. UYEF19]|uniref:hypothetical protein n=1 Tax=Nakamurella sp. UYEF19 TaxID=1756392 RepID=UPI003396AD88